GRPDRLPPGRPRHPESKVPPGPPRAGRLVSRRPEVQRRPDDRRRVGGEGRRVPLQPVRGVSLHRPAQARRGEAGRGEGVAPEVVPDGRLLVRRVRVEPRLPGPRRRPELAAVGRREKITRSPRAPVYRVGMENLPLPDRPPPPDPAPTGPYR